MSVSGVQSTTEVSLRDPKNIFFFQIKLNAFAQLNEHSYFYRFHQHVTY